MARHIFIVSTTDIWKSKDSARLFDACTSLPKLRRIIAKGIRENYFSYGGENLSFKKQEQLFREAWNKSYCDHDLDTALCLLAQVDYVFVEAIEEAQTLATQGGGLP